MPRAAGLLLAAALLLVLPSTLIQPGAARKDDLLKWAKENSWYNPSLVVYHDQLLSSAKKTERENRNDKSWWINNVYMCRGPKAQADELACKEWDPWASAKLPYAECEYTSDIRDGRVDNAGLGDVKLWVWPGRGVFAIFGRKPQRTAGSKYCDALVVYQQYLVQVSTDGDGRYWVIVLLGSDGSG